MSFGLTIPSAITDKAALVEVLKDLGFAQKGLEVFDTPQPLKGYFRRGQDNTAEVIIRRNSVNGLYSDVGFQKQGNGTLGLVVSSDDQAAGYNEAWLRTIQNNTLIKAALLFAKEKNYAVKQCTTANGRTHIVLAC